MRGVDDPATRSVAMVDTGPPVRSYDPGLWAGFNLLAYGPPGSGKLSFVKGLSRVANPLAEMRVYDLQTEVSVQKARIELLLSEMSSPRSEVVHVIRHLHRIRGGMLAHLMDELARIVSEGQEDASQSPQARLHATCYDGVRWPSSVKERLLTVFPCWVRMTEQCVSQRDLPRFVRNVVSELNRRYSRNVTEVDAEIIEALRRETNRSLHEMRNLIERVYIASRGQRLSRTVLDEVVCGGRLLTTQVA